MKRGRKIPKAPLQAAVPRKEAFKKEAVGKGPRRHLETKGRRVVPPARWLLLSLKPRAMQDRSA